MSCDDLSEEPETEDVDAGLDYAYVLVPSSLKSQSDDKQVL